MILPSAIYFDANVLLPTITDGHPLQPVYQEAIASLRRAAESAGLTFNLVVGRVFINEVVSHRSLALDLVKQQKLEVPENLRRHVMLYGAENTNVFVGAYASWVGRAGRRVPFKQFLSESAPYETEDELVAQLHNQGFAVEALDFRENDNPTFARLFAELRYAYEESPGWDFDPKPTILIQHEAQQLTQLLLDMQTSRRSVFTTADARLRRMLRTPWLRPLSTLTVTHVGLVQLADFLAGVRADSRSFARLYWATPRTKAENVIRDYLVARAVVSQDDAKVMAMQDLLDDFAHRAAIAAREQHLRFGARDAGEVARTTQFMDRLEDQFYEAMAEAIRRRARE